MKIILMLLCSLMAKSVYAESVQVVQDDIIKESAEALKCPPVTSINSTEPTGPTKGMKPVLETTVMAQAITSEEIEAPLKDLSATEKLKVYRQKLEEKNLILLAKKMEMIRLQQEMALLRNLERSMDQTLNAIEKIQHTSL